MKKVLFLCTHNSARSQIAQGLVNFFKEGWEAHSAGTVKSQVNPFAIKVMHELGINIVSHHSKTLDQYVNKYFDLIITVCDRAKENCPYFSNAKKLIHKSFKDPSHLGNTDPERLQEFRKTRDLMRSWIIDFFD